MTEKTIDLDQHRGMAAQKATALRRLLASVEANEKALRLRQDELEARLIAAPAANWQEAAEKARYLLKIFASSLPAQDPRRQKLIAAVLDEAKILKKIACLLGSFLDRKSTRLNSSHANISYAVFC